jgi:hypothetical protein
MALLLTLRNYFNGKWSRFLDSLPEITYGYDSISSQGQVEICGVCPFSNTARA